MKQLFLLVSALLMGAVNALAQDAVIDKVSALDTRLSTLEQTVTAQNSTISSLQSKVNEVTAQNLALKEALHLQPVVAEAPTESGLVLRLISAIGNRQSGKVIFTIEAYNPTKRDLKFQCLGATMIGETGSKATVRCVDMKTTDDQCAYDLLIYPDTPTEITLPFNIDDEPQYAKTINLQDCVRFLNIPIKWE